MENPDLEEVKLMTSANHQISEWMDTQF